MANGEDDQDYVDVDLETETTDDDTQTDDSEAKGDEGGIGKALKDTQAAYTKSRQELAELRKELQALREQGVARVDQKDWLDEVDDQALLTDPAAIKEMIRKGREETAEVIKWVMGELNGKLKNQHPDYLKYAQNIATLKDDPDYAGFSDDQLLVIAKKLEKPGGDEEDEDTPRSVAGNRSSRSLGAKKKVDIKQSPLFLKIYGDRLQKPAE